MINFEDGIDGMQEDFGTVQGIDVRLGGIFMEHFIGIEHDGRDTESVGPVADDVTLIVRDRRADDHAADMPGSKNFQGRFSSGNWYHSISGMS